MPFEVLNITDTTLAPRQPCYRVLTSQSDYDQLVPERAPDSEGRNLGVNWQTQVAFLACLGGQPTPGNLIRIEHIVLRSRDLTVTVGAQTTKGQVLPLPAETGGPSVQRLPGIAIRVINRGKGGEDAEEE